MGTLPSNIIKNPINDGRFLSITTQSSKEIVSLLIPIVNEPKNDSVFVNATPGVELPKFMTNVDSSQPLIGVDHSTWKDKVKGKFNEPVVKTIPWPPPSFP